MKHILSLALLAFASVASAQMPVPATTAGAPPATTSNDLSGTAISACGKITSPGNYYLTTNLTCPGTALMVSGPGIHLNLNGHTIVYGTAGGTMGTIYGIENDACWDTDQKPVTIPCDNSGAGIGVEIFNGSIAQSQNAPAFSHALYFGQNENTNQLINIHNLTITVQQTGSSGFFSTFQDGQILIEHNTIYDNVRSINRPGQSDQGARSQFQGEAIHVDNSKQMVAPDQIAYNKIVGSPQGGIRDTSTGAQVYQNDISMNALYANDFCVDVPGANERVYSNNCHPINGRGIHINSEGSYAYYNLITVTEAPVNREYNGCEGGGAYAVQVEDDIQHAGNVVVYGNTGTVNTGQCGGAALRITGWAAGSPAVVAHNSWIVNKTGGADQYGGMLYSFDASNLSTVIFGGPYGSDTLKTSDLGCVYFDWDGAQNVNISIPTCHATYAVVANNGPTNYTTYRVVNSPQTNAFCTMNSYSLGTVDGATIKCPK